MELYSYSKLKDSHNDIRLIELLPGVFDDKIRLRIHHVALNPQFKQARQSSAAIEEVRRTLPPKWTASKTYNGQYIYQFEDGNERRSSWIHPDPNFQHFNDDRQPQSKGGELPSYEALSYVWGSTKDQGDGLIESTSQPQGFGSLPLGKNLAGALQHLRNEKTARTLWVDAICINQSDMAEREAQVLRMADIYSCASRVVVWLGLDTARSSLAINTLSHLGQQVVATVEDEIMPAPEAVKPDWHLRSCELPYSSETWDSIEELLNREWFQRVWVIQEVRLADPHVTIQCGCNDISWDLFRRATKCLERKAKLPSEAFRVRATYVQNTMEGDYSVWPIADMLRIYGRRKATNLRDHVYGLLGLVSPEFRQRIKIQYNSSIGVVYTNFTAAHIEHTRRLELLGWQVDCPSWVPDFSIAPTLNQLGFQFASLHSACHAWLQAPDKLAIVGVKVTTIHSAKKMPQLQGLGGESAYQDVLTEIRKAEPAGLNEATYLTGETFREAYARTLIANFVRSRLPGYDIFEDIDQWQLQPSKNALFGEYEIGEALDVASLSWSERTALNKSSGRALVESEEGYIGLCPAETQKGDIIVVFLGCESPIALRPQGGGSYKVMGECYIHGLGDGAALLGPLPKPWIVQVFDDIHGLANNFCFFNKDTGEKTQEDPRLQPLSEEWVRIHIERTFDDPVFFDSFKHKVTGEVIKSDPRLRPEALKTRGVDLREFSLV
ncbi:heterokaryon incompatibility protein-domain-containing protein [Ilyonectria sp. MPI-CAGE-AT-0026]|nr:heterokaryon incompatibility protein-domain-containing protein [Ilyonectria sp. MPI-CAGE-AT-0026]